MPNNLQKDWSNILEFFIFTSSLFISFLSTVAFIFLYFYPMPTEKINKR